MVRGYFVRLLQRRNVLEFRRNAETRFDKLSWIRWQWWLFWGLYSWSTQSYSQRIPHIRESSQKSIHSLGFILMVLLHFELPWRIRCCARILPGLQRQQLCKWCYLLLVRLFCYDYTTRFMPDTGLCINTVWCYVWDFSHHCMHSMLARFVFVERRSDTAIHFFL